MKRTLGKIVYLSFFGFLLVVVGIVANSEAQKPPLIKVGQITDFTNPGIASYVVKQRNAAQMAIKELNTQGGIFGRSLELIVADNKSDATLAISHAKRLKEQGVIALIAGGTSTEALALGKWSQDEGHIPIIQAYAASDALNGHPWVFRSFNDTQVAEISLSIMQKLGKTKVGILHTTLAYGPDAANKTEKNASKFGIQIIGREALEFRATDATVQAMKLRDAGAEGVILCEYSMGVATFARALNTIGWRPPFTSSWGNVYNALAMSSPPTLMDGAIAQSVCDRENPRVKKVLQDYAKFTGKEGDIDDGIMLGYACVLVLVNAIKEAKSADNPVAIRDALYKIKMNDLPLGRKESVLNFTPERNWLVPNEDHTFMVIKGGKLEPFKLK